MTTLRKKNSVWQEDRARCKATTTKGKQCTREGTVYKDGKLYCPNHHAALIVKLMVKPSKATGPA